MLFNRMEALVLLALETALGFLWSGCDGEPDCLQDQRFSVTA